MLRDSGRGGAWPVLVMPKALLVGALYSLSEREALLDRLSFRRFVGLSLESAGKATLRYLKVLAAFMF